MPLHKQEDPGLLGRIKKTRKWDIALLEYLGGYTPDWRERMASQPDAASWVDSQRPSAAYYEQLLDQEPWARAGMPIAPPRLQGPPPTYDEADPLLVGILQGRAAQKVPTVKGSSSVMAADATRVAQPPPEVQVQPPPEMEIRATPPGEQPFEPLPPRPGSTGFVTDFGRVAGRRAYENVKRTGAAAHEIFGVAPAVYGAAGAAGALWPGGMSPGEGWGAGKEHAARIAQTARSQADMSEYLGSGIHMGGHADKVRLATDLAAFMVPAEGAAMATSALAGKALPWITRRAFQQMAAAPLGLPAPAALRRTMMAGRALEAIASPVMKRAPVRTTTATPGAWQTTTATPGVQRSLPGQVGGFMGRYAPVDVALAAEEDFPHMAHLLTAMRQEEIAAGGFDPSEHFLSRLGANVGATALMGAAIGAVRGRQGSPPLVGEVGTHPRPAQPPRLAVPQVEVSPRPAGPRAGEAVTAETLEGVAQRVEIPSLRGVEDRPLLQGPDVSYRGLHTAPSRGESTAPLHALDNIYPDDIYGPEAARFYGHGDRAMDTEVMQQLQSFRDRPDAMVTVYRAVPQDTQGVISPGDWVTPNRRYAEQHARVDDDPLNDFKVVEMEVRADELWTDANSPYEFGYDPQAGAGRAAAVDASISPAAPDAGVRAAGSAPAPSPITPPPPGAPLLLTELSESSIKRLGTPPETWSRLRRAIEEAPIQLSKKGTAQAPAWLTAIRKCQEPLGPTGVKVSGVRRGVRQEEMDQTGMEAFLREDPTRQLTREAMLERMDETEIRVSRMTKGKELIRPGPDHVTVEMHPTDGRREYGVNIQVSPHNPPPGLEEGATFSGEALDVGGRPEYQSGMGLGSRFATREEAERFRARILEGGVITPTAVPPAYPIERYQLGYKRGTRPPDYPHGVEEIHYSVDSPAMKERRGSEELTEQGRATVAALYETYLKKLYPASAARSVAPESVDLMESGGHTPNSFLAWAEQNALDARATAVTPSPAHEVQTPGDLDVPMKASPEGPEGSGWARADTAGGHIADFERLGWEVKLPEEWSMEQGIDRGVPIMRNEVVERAIQEGDVWEVLLPPHVERSLWGTAARLSVGRVFDRLNIETAADLARYHVDDLIEHLAPDIVHDLDEKLGALGLRLGMDPASLAGPMWRSLADVQFGYGYLPEGVLEAHATYGVEPRTHILRFGEDVGVDAPALAKELTTLLQPRMPASTLPPEVRHAERLLADAKLIHDEVVGEAHYGGESYHSDPDATFQRLRIQERIFQNPKRGREQRIGTLMENQSDVHMRHRGTEHAPPRRYTLEDLPEGSTVTPPAMSLEEEPPGIRVTPPREVLGEGLPSGSEMSPPKHTFPYDINKIRGGHQSESQEYSIARAGVERYATQKDLELNDQEMVKHLEAQLPEGSQVVFQELLLRAPPRDVMERPSGEPLIIYRVVLPPEIIERMPMEFRGTRSGSEIGRPEIFGRQQSRMDPPSSRNPMPDDPPHPYQSSARGMAREGFEHPREKALRRAGVGSLESRSDGATGETMVTWLDRDYGEALGAGPHPSAGQLDTAYGEFTKYTEGAYDTEMKRIEHSSGDLTEGQRRTFFDAPATLWESEMSALPPLPEGPIGIFSTVREAKAELYDFAPGEGGRVHHIDRDIGYPHRVGEPELLLDPEIAPTLAGLRLRMLDEVFAWLSRHPDYQWTVELPSSGPTWEGWLKKAERLASKDQRSVLPERELPPVGEIPVGVEWFPKDWDEQGLGRQLYVSGGSEASAMRNARKIHAKLPRHETQVDVDWYRGGRLAETFSTTGASKADALQALRDDHLRHQPEYQEAVQLPMRFSPEPISYEEVDVARRVDPRKLAGQWKRALAGKEPKKSLSVWPYGPHRLAGPPRENLKEWPGVGPSVGDYLPASAEMSLSGEELERLSGLRERGEGVGGRMRGPNRAVDRVNNPKYKESEGLVTFNGGSNTIHAPAGTAIAEARKFFGGSLPSMPFKSADARALVSLQKMVELSIERGWDGIALINADQQRRFYRADDLVSLLEYNPATHTLAGRQAGGEPMLPHNVPPDQLEQYVGGIAKKLLEPHNGFEVDGTLYDTLEEARTALSTWKDELVDRLEHTRSELSSMLGGVTMQPRAERLRRRMQDIKDAIEEIPRRSQILRRQASGVLRAEGDALIPGGPEDVFAKNYGEILPRSVYRYIPEIGGKAADVDMVDLGIPIQTLKTSDRGVFVEIDPSLMVGDRGERSVEVARVKTSEEAWLAQRRLLSDPEELRAALALAKPHEKEVADLVLAEIEGLQPDDDLWRYEEIVVFSDGKYRYESQGENTFFEVTPEMKKNYQSGGGGATFGIHGMGPVGGGLAGAMQEAESPEERWENIKRGAKLGLYAEVGARVGVGALKGQVPTNRLYSGIPDISRGKTPSGKPRSSSATTSITPLLSGQEKFVVPVDPKVGRPTIRTVGPAIDERAIAANGRVLDIEADRDQIVDAFHAEVLDHLKDPELAGGKEFYRSDLESAFQRIARHRPAVAADPLHLEAFRLSLAVTSQGIEVSQNAGYALQVYDDWAKTGRFNTSHGWGESRKQMKGAWEKWNRLADKITPQELFRLMDSQLPKGQLEAAGLKVSKELASEVLPGAVIFGSKIGGGFYHNLGGFYDFPTMDRWFRRAVGRITGTLMSNPSEQAMKDSASRFKSAVADYLNLPIEQLPSSTEELLDLASRTTREWEVARKANTYPKKTEWALAAAAFTNNWNPTVRDAPTTGTEKRQLRNIVRDLVERVPGQDAASLQALIWYPEKQLYRNLGLPVRVDPTYDSSFKEIFDARSSDVDWTQGDLGLGGEGGAGQGPVPGGLDPRGVGEARRLAGPGSTEFRKGLTPERLEEVLRKLGGRR